MAPPDSESSGTNSGSNNSLSTGDIIFHSPSAQIPKIPPFTSNDVADWFFKVECQLKFAKIDNDADQFLCLVPSLPNEITAYLPQDIVNSGKFSDLKQYLLKKFELDPQHKFENMVQGIPFQGTPGDYLHHLVKLGNEIGVSEPLVRHIFIKRLPQDIALQLTTFDGTLTDLALRANLLYNFKVSSHTFSNMVNANAQFTASQYPNASSLQTPSVSFSSPQVLAHTSLPHSSLSNDTANFSQSLPSAFQNLSLSSSTQSFQPSTASFSPQFLQQSSAISQSPAVSFPQQQQQFSTYVPGQIQQVPFPQFPSSPFYSSAVYPSRSRDRSSNSTMTPFRQGQRPKVCRFHVYYGSSAIKCTAWCQWPNKTGLQIFPSSRSNSPVNAQSSSFSQSGNG